LKSTTFAVDLLAYARSLRAFSHGFPQNRNFDFRKTTMRKQEHVFRKDHAQTQRPAAIRPLGITGKVPVRPERMDAIRNIKTMAGSPDADPACQHLAILRMVFVFQTSGSFVNP
jgi:hypothetical protein